jgi:predicted RNA methylase
MSGEHQYRDYDKQWLQNEMLFDNVRLSAFDQALARTVRPDSTVVEFGCGTGILSLFAARHGANKVVGIELSPTAFFARDFVTANEDLRERITILHGDAVVESKMVGQQADILVCEWLGGLAVDEGFVPSLLQTRDTVLKPGGKMIPARVSVFATLAFDPQVSRISNWLLSGISENYKINTLPFKTIFPNQVLNARNVIRPEHCYDAPQAVIRDMDMTTASHTDGDFDYQWSFVAQTKGKINVIAAWFEADMTGDGTVMLSNSPEHPDTHWGRTAFPLGKDVEVEVGDLIDVALASKYEKSMSCIQSWTVKVARGETIVHSCQHSGKQIPTHSPGFH